MMTAEQYEQLADLLHRFHEDEWLRVNSAQRGPQYLALVGSKMEEVENVTRVVELRAKQMRGLA